MLTAYRATTSVTVGVGNDEFIIGEGEIVMFELVDGYCRRAEFTNGELIPGLSDAVAGAGAIRAGWFVLANGEEASRIDMEAAARRVVDKLSRKPKLATAVFELLSRSTYAIKR